MLQHSSPEASYIPSSESPSDRSALVNVFMTQFVATVIAYASWIYIYSDTEDTSVIAGRVALHTALVVCTMVSFVKHLVVKPSFLFVVLALQVVTLSVWIAIPTVTSVSMGVIATTIIVHSSTILLSVFLIYMLYSKKTSRRVGDEDGAPPV